MSQTRKRSFYESFTSQVLGLAYAIPLNWVLFTSMHKFDPWTFAVVNTLIFLFAGLIFKYCLRRAFNWLDIHRPSS